MKTIRINAFSLDHASGYSDISDVGQTNFVRGCIDDNQILNRYIVETHEVDAEIPDLIAAVRLPGGRDPLCPFP